MKIHFPALPAVLALLSTVTATPLPIGEVVSDGYDDAISGYNFLLRSYAKTDLCLSDGGALGANQVKFTYAPCGLNQIDQTFAWDTVNNKLKSANKAGLCAKFVAAARRVPAHFTLDSCDSSATTLALSYDEDTMQLKIGTGRRARCVDDNGGWGLASERINLRQCTADDDDQQFYFQSPSSQVGSDYFTRPSPIVFKICSIAQPTFCLADTGDATTSNPSVVEMLSEAEHEYAEANWFVYKWDTQSIRSWKKPSMCISSVASATGQESVGGLQNPWVLEPCDDTNLNQRFVYNDYTNLLSIWTNRKQCMSTVQPMNSVSKTVSTVNCNLNADQHQRVSIIEVDGQDPELPNKDSCAKVVSRSLRKLRKQRK